MMTICCRAVTMFITVLPKPDESYVCAAKIDELTPYGKLALQCAAV